LTSTKMTSMAPTRRSAGGRLSANALASALAVFLSGCHQMPGHVITEATTTVASAEQSAYPSSPPNLVESAAPAQASTLDLIRRAEAATVGDYEYATFTDDKAPLAHHPGTVTFTTPSENITCGWRTDGTGSLACGLKQRTTPAPPRPSDCEEYLGWSTNYVKLDASGATDGYCAGGIPIPYRGNKLPYGTALIAAEFGCLSEEKGVTCAHFSTGSGFFLSREQFKAL